MNARASTRLSWVSVCKINMAAFLWARRLNQSSFLGCFLSNLSFVSESRSFFRLGLYAGDLKSRKQGLVRRDFSTEEVSINFRYHVTLNSTIAGMWNYLIILISQEITFPYTGWIIWPNNSNPLSLKPRWRFSGFPFPCTTKEIENVCMQVRGGEVSNGYRILKLNICVSSYSNSN